ncbi:hypothetical protein KI387_035168, partial [Taxus chinensis]
LFLVDESIMEENSKEDMVVPNSPLEQQFKDFSLTSFMLEEEVIQGQDGLQTPEEGEAAPNPKEEEEKRQEDVIISLTPSTQEGPQ